MVLRLRTISSFKLIDRNRSVSWLPFDGALDWPLSK